MATRGQRIRGRLLHRYWQARERQRVVAQRGWVQSPVMATPGGGDDFRPVYISGCRLWVRADYDVYSDAGVTPSTDGGAVQQWNDQSGNANHFIQTTAGQQPLLIFNAVNGRRVVRFDGSNDVLVTASLNPGVPIAQPTTIIIVATVAAIAAAQVLFDGITTRQYLFKDAGATAGAYYGAPTQVTGENPHTWGSFEIYTCMFNSTTSALYINGVAKGTGDGGTAGLTRILLGANSAAGGAPASMDTPEFIVYEKALSGGERNLVDNYLGRRYGIAVI